MYETLFMIHLMDMAYVYAVCAWSKRKSLHSILDTVAMTLTFVFILLGHVFKHLLYRSIIFLKYRSYLTLFKLG